MSSDREVSPPNPLELPTGTQTLRGAQDRQPPMPNTPMQQDDSIEKTIFQLQTEIILIREDTAKRLSELEKTNQEKSQRLETLERLAQRQTIYRLKSEKEAEETKKTVETLIQNVTNLTDLVEEASSKISELSRQEKNPLRQTIPGRVAKTPRRRSRIPTSIHASSSGSEDQNDDDLYTNPDRRYSTVPPPPPETPRPRPLKMTNPPEFNGDTNKFRRWDAAMASYMTLYQEYFEGRTSEERVLFIGNALKDEALAWFQQYTRRQVSLGEDLTIRKFSKAMKDRFISETEDVENLRKMDKIRYTGDIDQYLRKIRDYNEQVQLSGVGLRNRIENGLPEEIKDLLALNEDPRNDDQFFRQVERAGRRIQTKNLKKKDLQQRNPVLGKREDPRTKVDKSPLVKFVSDNKKRRESTETPRDGSTRLFRPKKEPRTNKDGKTFAELTAGIPEEQVKRRMEEKKCARCGLDGHEAWNCKGAIRIGALELDKEEKDWSEAEVVDNSERDGDSLMEDQRGESEEEDFY